MCPWQTRPAPSLIVERVSCRPVLFFHRFATSKALFTSWAILGHLTENEVSVRIELADPAEARMLTSIQAEAFDHEADLFRMETNRGPDGYDSVEATRALIGSGSLWKISLGDETVGGMVVTVMGDGRARINRIFVDPGHQRKGVGGRAMGLIQSRYPEVTVWELDTPSWAVRNQKFYEKQGFVHVGHTLEPVSGFILYIYRMQGAGIR